MKKNAYTLFQKTWFLVVCLVFLALPIILPYFHPGFFPTHDGEWAVVRLSEMFRELRDHQFPARYSGYLNNGYGYPLFNFVYPGPYYLGVPFVLLKLGFVNTIKLLFAAGVIIGGIGMFFASERLWNGRLAGFVSAIFYLYLPYHLVDLYVRGSIGETLSFAVIPWVLLGVLLIKKNKQSSLWIGVTALFIGLLVLVHNIMALVFAPIIVVFMATQVIPLDTRLAGKYVLSLLLGFGLSAFFWIPALVEKNLILLSKIPIADRSLYFVSLNQFILPSWGYGTPTEHNPFTYQLGWPILICVILAGIVLLVSKFQSSKNDKEHLVGGILLIVWIGYTLMLFSFTAPLWKALPLLKEINYPWTLLGPIGFVSALLVGVLSKFNRLIWIVVGLAVISVIFFIQYAKPSQYVDHGEGFYMTNTATTTSSNELMPLWVKSFPQSLPSQKIEVVKGRATFSAIQSASQDLSAQLNVQKVAVVRINTIYFPGWKVTLNEKSVPISYNNPSGVMEISVPSGNWSLVVHFSETIDRLVSDIVSILSGVAVVFFLVFGFWKVWVYKTK